MADPFHEQAGYQGVEPILDAIANWVKRYRYHTGLRHDLAACGPEEVARAAQDLGVSPGELVRLAEKGPDAADELPRLLRALGVDPGKLASKDPIVMRDLQRLCISCTDKSRCRHELAAGTAASHYHEFCPNAVTLDALFDGK
jgi:hypothetical protein